MLIIILSSIAGVLLFAFIFVMLHPGFGGNVTRKDKEAYASRTDESYFRKYEFTNGDGFELMTGGKGENNLYSSKGKKPKDELPAITPVFLSDPGVEDFSYTWFGHSAFVLSNHAWDDSAERFARDYESKHSDPKYLITPKPGQILYGGKNEKEFFERESLEKAGIRWWRDYE